MIFSLFSRVVVKLGEEERHVFDRARLMYTEVQEIEKITGLSYGEWEQALAKYSITAVAALIHVLRKREGQPSDFASMQFNAAALDVVPLKDDDTEMTAAEVAADLAKRAADAAEAANPTPGAAGALIPVPAPETPATATSPSSPNGTESAHGSGSGSPGGTSSSSKRTRISA